MTSAPGESAAPSAAVAPPPTRFRTVLQWIERLSPWVSLLVSAVSAALMDRRQEQGSWIVGSAALVFAALVALGVAHRQRALEPSTRRARVLSLVRFATLSGSQSLLQTCLFFAAPFYFQASAFTPAQCVFAAAFVAAGLVVTWDPWCKRALLHPVIGPVLSAFASFVAWNAALPMLGVSHRSAIWLAAGSVSVLVPAVYLLQRERHPRVLRTVLAGAVVPLFLAAFGVRSLPAAPLKLVQAGIGTGIENRGLTGQSVRFAPAPPKLWCYSAIFAPRGLSEDLLHVWSIDGRELSRIPLNVRGGRKQGFRTWSFQPVPRLSRGTYRCEVLTQFGQTLGVSEARVGPATTRDRSAPIQ